MTDKAVRLAVHSQYTYINQKKRFSKLELKFSKYALRTGRFRLLTCERGAFETHILEYHHFFEVVFRFFCLKIHYNRYEVVQVLTGEEKKVPIK